jgi:hypothetical protein
VRTLSPKFTPNWKEIILVSPDWPDNLTVPQNDELPEDSEPLRSDTCTSERWVWELWRHPDGHCYYIKAWPQDEADPENPDTPGAALTVMFLASPGVTRPLLGQHFHSGFLTHVGVHSSVTPFLSQRMISSNHFSPPSVTIFLSQFAD